MKFDNQKRKRVIPYNKCSENLCIITFKIHPRRDYLIAVELESPDLVKLFKNNKEKNLFEHSKVDKYLDKISKVLYNKRDLIDMHKVSFVLSNLSLEDLGSTNNHLLSINEDIKNIIDYE